MSTHSKSKKAGAVAAIPPKEEAASPPAPEKQSKKIVVDPASTNLTDRFPVMKHAEGALVRALDNGMLYEARVPSTTLHCNVFRA
jgi:hypothetical protein